MAENLADKKTRSRSRSKDDGSCNRPHGYAERLVARDVSDNLFADFNQSVLANTKTLLSKYDSQVNARFSAVESAAIQTDSAVRDLQHTVKDMQREIGGLRDGVAMAAKPEITFEEIRDSDFARATNPAVIQIHVRAMVSRASLQAVLSDWILESVKDTEFAVHGPALGKRFVAKFSGEAGLAARRARKVFDSLKSDAGW